MTLPQGVNEQKTLMQVVAEATAQTSKLQTNFHHRGAYIFINIVTRPAAETLLPQVRGYNPLSDEYWNILLEGSAIGAAVNTVYLIYPGVGSAADGIDQVAPFPLPFQWDITMPPSASGNWTYDVMVHMLK